MTEKQIKNFCYKFFTRESEKGKKNVKMVKLVGKEKKVGEIVRSDQCGLYYKIVARRVQRLGLEHSYDLVLGGMGGRNEL